MLLLISIVGVALGQPGGYDYCQYDPDEVGCNYTYGCKWDDAKNKCVPSTISLRKKLADLKGVDYCQYDPDPTGCNYTYGCQWDDAEKRCKPTSMEAKRANLAPANLKDVDYCQYDPDPTGCNYTYGCQWDTAENRCKPTSTEAKRASLEAGVPDNMCCDDHCGENGWMWSGMDKDTYCKMACGYCYHKSGEVEHKTMAGDVDYCQYDPDPTGCNYTYGCHWDDAAKKCKPTAKESIVADPYNCAAGGPDGLCNAPCLYNVYTHECYGPGKGRNVRSTPRHPSEPYKAPMQCPGSKAPDFAYAWAHVTVQFDEDCATVRKEVEARAKMEGGWTDPHNGGKYDLNSASGDVIVTDHYTGSMPHFHDKQMIVLEDNGSGCTLYGCSDSQGVSAADGSTNYCNLHNLYANEKKDKVEAVHTDLTYNEKKKSSQLGALDLDVRQCNTMKAVKTGKLSIPYNYCQWDPEKVGCENTYGCEWDDAEGYCKPSDSEKAQQFVAGYDYCQYDPDETGCNATYGCHWDAAAKKCKPTSEKKTTLDRLAKHELLRPLKSADQCIYITSDIMCNMQSNCHWVGYACAPGLKRKEVHYAANRYARVEHGNCEQSGMATITSEDECIEATAAFTAEEKANGWQYQDCEYRGSGNTDKLPVGCVNSGATCDSGFSLNMAAYSPVDCSRDLPCMCKLDNVEAKTMAAAAL